MFCIRSQKAVHSASHLCMLATVHLFLSLSTQLLISGQAQGTGYGSLQYRLYIQYHNAVPFSQ